MPLSLPPEICCIIFRLATDVVKVLDTSTSTIEGENRDVLLPLIRQSIHFKATLSIVSKEFHSIMETILYEVILITQFSIVPVLLERLRSNCYGFARPRGHVCRRLDIHLGTWGDAGYLDEAWYEGGHTLWGLVPACPRLEILIARVIYRKPKDEYFGVPHLTHNALWKTISSCCANTLRRLELFGFSIRLDRVELMLRYMSNLEVCDISHCRPFAPIALPWKYAQDIANFHPEIFDEEEPRTRKVWADVPWEGYFHMYPSRFHDEVRIIQSRRARRSRVPRNWFQQNFLDEFEDAELNAVWPPFSGGGPPYVLSKLHTLHFSCFTYRFFNFLLPSLKSLYIEQFPYSGPESDLIFDDNPAATYVAYGGLKFVGPNSELPVGRVQDGHIVLNHHLSHRKVKMKVKYLPSPDSNGTLFGHFPNCVTHLRVANSYLAIEKVIHFFPNIISLTWECPWDGRQDPVVPVVRNATLRSITMHLPKVEADVRKLVDELFNAIEKKGFLGLEDITMLHWKHIYLDDRPCPLEELLEKGKRLGIRLAIQSSVAQQNYEQTFYHYPQD